MIVTSGGKKTAPAHIEGLLKALEPVGNAMVVGEGRNYLVALLALDPEQVAGFAAKHGFPVDVNKLVADPRFKEHLQGRIEREVNSRLSQFETIKKFEVLPHDFTVDGGELTSTMKVRRKVVEAKYADRITRLYGSG